MLTFFPTLKPVDLYKHSLHLGSSKLSLSHNFNIGLLEGFRNDLAIYKIDKLFLNIIYNKNLIIKLSKNHVNFTFLTTRKEFGEILDNAAFDCLENFKLWNQGLFGSFHHQDFFDKKNKSDFFFKFNFWFTFRTDCVIMFNNTVNECKLPFLELKKKNIPTLTLIDTDSIISDYFFPIYSNDDSIISINFYSSFFSHVILNTKFFIKNNPFKKFFYIWQEEELIKDKLYNNEIERLNFLKKFLTKESYLKEVFRFNNKKIFK